MVSISTLVDRVKIIVQSSGTGAFELGPAVPAFRGVEALINGATYSYATENGERFEAGTGVYNSSLGVLVRTPIISSNGGAAVSFPANIELAFTALAQDIVATGATFPIVQAPGGSTIDVMSQKAVTDAIFAVLSGSVAWSLPDEANGDAIPATGSGFPYLSAGVFKIA